MSIDPNEPLIQLIQLEDTDRWEWQLLTPSKGGHTVRDRGSAGDRGSAAECALQAAAQYEAEQAKRLLLTIAEARAVANPKQYIMADGRYAKITYDGESSTVGEWSAEARDIYEELRAIRGFYEVNDTYSQGDLPTVGARGRFWIMASPKLQDRGWEIFPGRGATGPRHTATYTKGDDELTIGWASWGETRAFGWTYKSNESENS